MGAGNDSKLGWRAPFLRTRQFGNEAGIIFDSIDTQAGTGRIIGNVQLATSAWW